MQLLRGWSPDPQDLVPPAGGGWSSDPHHRSAPGAGGSLTLGPHAGGGEQIAKFPTIPVAAASTVLKTEPTTTHESLSADLSEFECTDLTRKSEVACSRSFTVYM